MKLPSVGATDAESFEALLRNLRRSRAADALSALQRQAEQRGLDRLTLDEINEGYKRSAKIAKAVEDPPRHQRVGVRPVVAARCEINDAA